MTIVITGATLPDGSRTDLLIDKGVIAERGTHQMLLLRDGLYAQMWNRQREATEAEELARKKAADAEGFIKRPLPAAE